jgi:predicted O-methyltransferase YrrM
MTYDELFHRVDQSQSGFTQHYAFLLGLIRGMRPEHMLEFGCGLSSIIAADMLSKTGGTLTTLDMRDISETGNSASDLQTYAGTWTYVRGDSRETVRSLPDTGYDLVLHDGSHTWHTVLKDIRAILPKIKKNGILLVHDTQHPQLGRAMRLGVQLGLLFTCHAKVTLPYGYGLTIVRIYKNSPYGEYKDTWVKNNL